MNTLQSFDNIMDYLKIARDHEHTVLVGGSGDKRLVHAWIIVPRMIIILELERHHCLLNMLLYFMNVNHDIHNVMIHIHKI